MPKSFFWLKNVLAFFYKLPCSAATNASLTKILTLHVRVVLQERLDFALFHVSNFSLFVSVQVLTRLQKQREKNYF